VAVPLITFTVLEEPTDEMRALGAAGLISTKSELTPRIIEALNLFWAEHSAEYEVGDSFTIDIRNDA
jgi:hypothetical protein